MKMAMPNIEIDEENLSEQSSLVSDVGLTSVGILYIVIAIEEFFSIRFDNVGFGDFKTVGDVVNYIEKKIEELNGF